MCSDAAAADKHHVYGAVAPHVVLPFVVEHAGALGREADKFFHACVKKLKLAMTCPLLKKRPRRGRARGLATGTTRRFLFRILRAWAISSW